MIGTKLGRSIGTGIHRKDVPIVKCIIEATEKRCQPRLFKIRVRSFPKANGTCLKVVITKLIGIEIGHSGVKTAISLFLKFRQGQHIKIMFIPVLFIGQHQIAKQ